MSKVFIYKNTTTGKYIYYRFAQDDNLFDTLNVHDAYKFSENYHLYTGNPRSNLNKYKRIDFDKELQNIRKEKLEKLNGK